MSGLPPGTTIDAFRVQMANILSYVTGPSGVAPISSTASIDEQLTFLHDHVKRTNHPDFSKISREKMATEIETCDNYLREKFGYSSPYFRFPMGSYSASALDLVSSLGYKSVFWSVAYADWDVNDTKGKQYAFDTVTSRLHPGAVILLHSVSPDNAAALGDIFDWARKQGYEFRSLEQLPN